MESRLFQDALEVAETGFGASARVTCLKCHAPIAVERGDLSLCQKVSWEGITCDYCHSVKEVALAGPNPRAVVPLRQFARPVTNTVTRWAFPSLHHTPNGRTALLERGQGLSILHMYRTGNAPVNLRQMPGSHSLVLLFAVGEN